MLYINLLLYGIAFGLIGFGLFSLFVRTNKKRAITSIVIGIALVVAAMLFGGIYLPVTKGERSIVVYSTKFMVENDQSVCKVYDDYTQLQYEYIGSETEKFCAQFKVGEEYVITYRVEQGIFRIVDIRL